MNDTTKLLFDALSEERAFSTPEIENAWSEILALAGAKTNRKLENEIADAIGNLWSYTCQNAFQVGIRAAVKLFTQA